jgi:hypothetical protein
MAAGLFQIGIRAHTQAVICTYVCMHVLCMCVYMHVHHAMLYTYVMYVSLYGMCVCMYVCMYVCMCMTGVLSDLKCAAGKDFYSIP